MNNNLVNLFKDIAKAIRLKTGINDKIKAQDFPQKIKEIPQEKKEEGTTIKVSQIINTPFSDESQKVVLNFSEILVKQVFKNEETGEFSYGA